MDKVIIGTSKPPLVIYPVYKSASSHVHIKSKTSPSQLPMLCVPTANNKMPAALPKDALAAYKTHLVCLRLYIDLLRLMN